MTLTRDYWLIAAVVLVILLRDRIVLALLVLVVPKCWLIESIEKAIKKGGVK